MNYLGIVSYRGTDFQGFQSQKSGRTVQASLDKVLSFVCGEPIHIHGAGRTDAGVHALAQGISFKTSSSLPPEKLKEVVNRLLDKDVYLISLTPKDDSFDARHSLIGKTYEYRFSYGQRSPFEVGLVTQLERDGFEETPFRESLSYFVGTHDFSNFTSKKEDVDGFIRQIDSIVPSLDSNEKKGFVRFAGAHFMTYQIRFMMGVAFECAYNRLDPKQVPLLLEKKPRQIVPWKADPEGLYLTEVRYAD